VLPRINAQTQPLRDQDHGDLMHLTYACDDAHR
jgi:hypothetical protein